MVYSREKNTGEHTQESPEVLLERLTRMPDTSGRLRKTLGAGTVREFMEIMTSLPAVETEWLCLCGDLTPEQADQYNTASGDYDACARQLMGLAVRFAETIKPFLIRLVQNEIRGQRKEGIYNLFECIRLLHETRFERIKDLPVFSVNLGEGFVFETMALVGADLIDSMHGTNVTDLVRGKIQEFLDSLEKIFRETTGREFPGTQFFRERVMYKEAFGRVNNRECLERAIGFSTDGGREQQSKIRDDMLCNLELVKEDRLYKRIPLITLYEDRPQIIAMRDDPITGHRYGSICAVRINFRKEKLTGFPPFIQDQQERFSCDYGVLPDVVNFSVDPISGDLCFITSGIPLTQVLSEEHYLALQYFILERLRVYLENKDLDVVDYLQGETYSRHDAEGDGEPNQEERHQSPEEGLPKEGNGEPAIEHMPQEQEVPAPQESRSMPKHIWVEVRHCIRGASAEEILATLRGMFGQEEKIRGSHIFFRSDRNGVLLSVPKHSRRDKHHISLDLIMHNLKMWGYSPEEFAEKLGLRISQRVRNRLSKVNTKKKSEK